MGFKKIIAIYKCVLCVSAFLFFANQTIHAQEAGYRVSYKFYFEHRANWPCGDYVRFYLTGNDGKVYKPVDWIQGQIKCNVYFKINQADTMILPVDKQIKNIRMSYFIRTQTTNSGSCNICNGITYETPPWDPYNHNIQISGDSISRNWFDGNANTGRGVLGNYEFVQKPFIKKITASSDLLPHDDKTNLSVPSGLPSDLYNWEYSTDGTKWMDLPGNLNTQGQHSINISLVDVVGPDFQRFIGQNIYFRIRLNKNIYSDQILTLSARISAPHINSITALPNNCFGESNGGFKVYFDRALISGESLNLVITETTTGDIQNVSNVTSLEDGNVITTPLNFPPGNYKIELIDTYNGTAGYSDAPNHTGTASFTGPGAVDFSTSKSDILCRDGKDGTITINASGGNGGYKVLYKKQEEAVYTEITFATAGQHIINGLDVGTYKVRVLDQNGCYKKDSNGNEVISTIVINQPDEALKIDNKQVTHPTAFGATDGKAEAIITGGTPNAGNYNVQWTDAKGNVLSNFTNTNNPFKTTLNNAGDGKYILRVTDNNHNLAKSENAKGCIAIDTFTLTQPKPLSVVIEKQKNIDCNGNLNGELYAKVMGGVQISGQKYVYQWLKEVDGTFTTLTQTDSILTAVGAGIYKVNVKDNNQVSATSEPFTLTEPSTLNFKVSKRDIYCFGGKDGTITINATGANGAYKLLYKNQTDVNYTTVAIASSGQHQLTNLDTGNYIIRVADSSGCYQKDANGAEVIQTITITQPAGPLKIDARNIVNPTAFGANDGRAEISISGGTPTAGSYNVQWTDINGNPLSNVINTTNPFKTVLNDAADGKYILRVTDSNYALAQTANASSCILIDTITLKQPPPLKVEIEELKYISCKGDADGKLYAKAAGGIVIPGLKYKYEWFKQTDGTYTPLTQTDSIFINANAGIFKVKITDQNNITKESIPFNLTEPVALAVTVSSTQLICSGDSNGTANVTVTGGTLPYHIEWSTGDTTTNIKNLTDGNYLVFVTDGHGCQIQTQVNVAAPNALLITADLVKNPTCFGSNDGAINHTVTGGIPPYQYLWSNGSTTQNLSNLLAGTYTLTVTESKGCSKTISYNLTQPEAVKIDLGPDITLCVDQVHEADATIPNGAVYKWTSNNGFAANTAKVSLSTSGIYYVEALTDKGCVGRDTIEIKKSSAVIASEFVVTTQTFKNETIHLVNISSPKPQNVEWLIPGNTNIKVLSKTDDDLQLSFSATGTYSIGLKATVGDCFKIFTKQVTVIEGTSFNDPGTVKDPFIKSFIIAPNPSNGNFNAKIELQESTKIKLRLLNTITGQLIDTREESGNSSYNLPYSLTLSTGVYVMVLETPKGNMVYKVVIQ